MHAHANGLRLLASDAYRVTNTPEGFLIEPASGNEQRRDPLVISIRLLVTQPEIASDRQHQLDSGRSLRYSVTHDEEGGSGGVDYTLIALEHIDGRWIQYRQRKQSEHGEPEFELWDIAGGLSYAGSP